MPSTMRRSHHGSDERGTRRVGVAHLVAALAVIFGLSVPATLAMAQGSGGAAKPAPSNAPATLQAFQQGTLAGNTGGTFNYYQIKSPGPTPLSMSLTYSPFIASQAPGVGFSAYQAGNQVGNVTASGPRTAGVVSPDPKAGPVVIQVFNYSPTTISYQLRAPIPDAEPPTGSSAFLTPTPSAASTATAPAVSTQASAPATLLPTQTATMPGNTGGTYQYYQIARPSVASIRLAMSYYPFNAANAHQVGFNVFQDGARIGGATGLGTSSNDSVNSNVPTTAIAPSSGDPILIQVFNYTPDSITYTLAQS